MRMKKFFVRHRKLCSILVTLFVLIAIGGVALFYSNDTKAEVYIKNENGKYVERSELKILEIVAQNGQQVFGYTIPGYEPIPRNAIHNYATDINSFDEVALSNLTGYTVKKSGGKLKVDSAASKIDNVFNLNVLADSMSAGQVKVTVCQANQLTADLIHSADLIYINTNNYGCDDTLYYYDKLVNGGAGNITKGDKGAFYNTSIEVKKVATDYIIETLKKACGRLAVARRLTAEDYRRLGITQFKECNMSSYCSELSMKSKGAFDSITIDNLQPLIDMIERVNNVQRSKAVREINNSYNTGVINDTIIETLYNALLKADIKDVLEVNKRAYVEMMVTSNKPLKTYDKIQNAITKVAVDERNKAWQKLVEYKKDSNEHGYEYMTINDDRKAELRASILKMAVPATVDTLAEAYAIEFLEDASAGFQFTDETNSSQCLADIETLILQINEVKKMESIRLIADAVEDDLKLQELKKDPAHHFEVASQEGGLVGYIDYNTDAYVKKLETLADGALKTADVADLDKIKSALFDVVNEESKFTSDYLTSDISWDMALELYQYAIVDEKALMYDSQIMTENYAGNYKDDVPENTCNLYKILLLMRQLQPEYCQGEIMTKIDELGTYYPEGIGVGTGISAWYRGTFCPDFANEGGLDKMKFREPAVLGQTYATNGKKGASRNYVYKHIYTFTGDQFFGGAGFINGTNGNNFDSNNTAKDNQADASENRTLQVDQTMSLEGQSVIVPGANKGRVIRYIMEMELNFYDSYPIRVLELQPGSGDSYWSNPAGAYANLHKLASYLGITPVKNAGEGDDFILRYFEVTRMSVREFNTRQEDLTGVYDLIYIGVEPGYMPVDKNGRTVFNSYNKNDLKGYVYYSIGPVFDSVNRALRGTVPDDFVVGNPNKISGHEYTFWVSQYGTQLGLNVNTTYQLANGPTANAAMGNDLTVKSMNRLFEYARAGYPIALDIGVYNCDRDAEAEKLDAKEVGYVHKNTKMYNFVHILKQMGRNNSLGDFDGVSMGDVSLGSLSGLESSLGDIINGSVSGGCIFKDGCKYANLVRIRESSTTGNYAAVGKNPENNKTTRTNFQGGLKHAMKRSTKVSFKLVQSPQQYQYAKGVTDVYDSHEDDSKALAKKPDGTGSIVEDTKNYRFVVDVKSAVDASWLEQNYTYQVIIDKSGTGRFEEKDVLNLDPSHVYKKQSNGDLQVVLQGRWPGDMEGYIPWRVEVARKDNPENHYTYTGFSAFRPKKPKQVYLLWVMTEATKDGSIMKGEWDANGKLADIWRYDFNLNFAEAIEQNKQYIYDYEIKLITLTYSEYLSLYSGVALYGVHLNTITSDSQSRLKIKSAYNMIGKNLNNAKEFKKNVSSEQMKKSPYCTISKAEIDAMSADKMFDMIVFGFSDTYTGQDIPSIPALLDLKYFVKSGRSFMFAHDNSSYVTSLNHYQTWSYHTTPVLRSILGMDAYGVGYSVEDNQDPALVLAKNNARKYLGNPDLRYLRGFTDMYTDLYASYNSGTKGSLPLAAKMYMHTKAATDMTMYNGDTSKSGGVWKVSTFNEVNRTTRVKRVNQGQLSDYPFIIGESLDTAPTHAQWLSLNMELEDLTVWYTLQDTEIGYNKGRIYKSNQCDGANNYYIYSKGNVTYTGAGHDPGMTTTEVRLFINTVVAAIKAGNWAPEVVFPDSQSNARGESVVDHYPDEKNGMVVAFKPIDYDSPNIPGVFSDCKIFIDVNKDGKYDSGDYYLFIDMNQNRVKVPGENTPINLTGNDLINKQRVDFEIPQNILDDMKNRGIDIYSYPITFQLKDKGTKNARPEDNTETEITTSLYISKSELHNLR